MENKMYGRSDKVIVESTERQKQGLDTFANHSCEDNAVYYEFTEDNHRYHGYECGICGKLLQTG